MKANGQKKTIQRKEHDDVKLKLCPMCKKMKGPSHFYACLAGASGGGSVHGAKKARGNSSYYAYLQRRKVAKLNERKNKKEGV